MIIETRVFNRKTGKMVYFKPLRPFGNQVIAEPVIENEQEQIELDVNDPVMLKTPILSVDRLCLWEGDICSCGVITSYGLVKEQGIIVMRPDKGGFTLQIAKQYEDQTDFSIVELMKLGNMYENPDLLAKKKVYDKTHTPDN